MVFSPEKPSFGIWVETTRNMTVISGSYDTCKPDYAVIYGKKVQPQHKRCRHCASPAAWRASIWVRLVIITKSSKILLAKK